MTFCNWLELQRLIFTEHKRHNDRCVNTSKGKGAGGVTGNYRTRSCGIGTATANVILSTTAEGKLLPPLLLLKVSRI